MSRARNHSSGFTGASRLSGSAPAIERTMARAESSCAGKRLASASDGDSLAGLSCANCANASRSFGHLASTASLTPSDSSECRMLDLQFDA